MLEKILGTLAVILAFLAVLYFHLRRKPDSCDGSCGACGDFDSCPSEEKFLRSKGPPKPKDDRDLGT